MLRREITGMRVEVGGRSAVGFGFDKAKKRAEARHRNIRVKSRRACWKREYDYRLYRTMTEDLYHLANSKVQSKRQILR